MKKYLLYIGISLGFLFMVSCGKDKTYPSTPILKYKSIYPKELSVSDSVAITSEFKDKEGDIKGEDIFWYRVVNLTTPAHTTGFDSLAYPVPNFPQNNNVGGELILVLKPGIDFSVGAMQGSGSDSIYFELFIKDQAGHISDTIHTDTVLVHN